MSFVNNPNNTNNKKCMPPYFHYPSQEINPKP